MREKESNPLLNDIYLSLGANIDPVNNINRAIKALSKHGRLISKSSLWANPPVGIKGPDFVNCAVFVQNDLGMHNFKRSVLRKIESDLGRVRSTEKFVSRSIDIDILIFNRIEIEIDIWRYAYLAVPLAEIYPSYKHSSNHVSLHNVASSLQSESEIYVIN